MSDSRRRIPHLRRWLIALPLAAAGLAFAYLDSADAAEAASRPAAETHGASAVAAPGDPLDTVRERLAAKLGATKAPNTPNPYVLRVTSKGGAGGAPEEGRHATSASAHGSTVAMATRPEEAARPAATHGPVHWDYAGAEGPERWAELDPAYAACANGKRQSPIDIRDGIKVDLDPVQVDYHPSTFSVVDNGHTVQVNVAPGNFIETMGRRFELVQFHFHRPSEERIDGKQFDMVAHLVHKDVSGRLAVIAVLLERGSAQPVVQRIWNNLPLEHGDEVRASGTIDPAALLPAERRYYTYMGSLTTPPCSEGVLWMVMKNPVPVSAEQIGVFSRLYPMNARPLQSASGRLIKESN
ncbi:MAG: carbonic anhydrase [Proteobacteria bacterium]|nr:carbonic anhydrase [Pseudomonadota bacterium]